MWACRRQTLEKPPHSTLNNQLIREGTGCGPPRGDSPGVPVGRAVAGGGRAALDGLVPQHAGNLGGPERVSCVVAHVSLCDDVHQ
jgi:hypothetical protein